MLILIFEAAEAEAPERELRRAREIIDEWGGSWLGETPARHWLEHRYSVSYRQAPLFASGVFVDTMEVATTWSKVDAVYEGVRRALGPTALAMAHFSHAYPDGCCIYFSFVGSADPALKRKLGWDAACEATYDRAWSDALGAAIACGGTLAHHHGVGRSKAPLLRADLGVGIDIVRATMRAFDPAGILNPGNLVSSVSTALPSARPSDAPPAESWTGVHIDHASLLARIDGHTDLADAERTLNQHNLTLDVRGPLPHATIAQWLATGAAGARDPWLDPVDHLVAGLEATLTDGRPLRLRPAPRRSVGPDLLALFVGAQSRFGNIDRAWLRVHRRGVVRPTAPPFAHERDPASSVEEGALVDAIALSVPSPSFVGE